MLTEAVIGNKAYAKFNVPGDCTVDTIALNVIKQDCPDFLLPIRTMEINGELEIRYEMTDGVRLSYESNDMLKKDFTTLLINLLTPFKVCGDWFLNRNNICLDQNYIMLRKDGLGVRYVYIPVSEYAQTDAQITDFFFNILLSKKVIDEEEFTIELMRVLKSGGPNSLMELLDTLQNKAPQLGGGMSGGYAQTPNQKKGETWTAQSGQGYSDDELRTNTFAGAGNVQRIQQTRTEERPQSDKKISALADERRPTADNGSVKNQLIDQLYGEAMPDRKAAPKSEKPKRGIFSSFRDKNKDRAQKEMQQQSTGRRDAGTPTNRDVRQGTANNNARYTGSDNTDVDDTVVGDNSVLRLRLAEKPLYSCPQFIEIPLTKGSATIGRYDKAGNPRSDYNFDESLSFVSHKHLRVERNGSDGWVIIDLDSTNKTYLNGVELAPNARYPLTVGDTIMMSAKNRLIYTVC